MFRKWLASLGTAALVSSLIPASFASAAGPTISVKLVNNLGNTYSVPISTTGSYSTDVTNERLGGANRFEVAANVAEKGWSNSGTILLANYMAFADALSATPYAVKLNAPILLTKKDDLTQTTIDEIKNLNASKAVIIGGPGSVSTAVESQLKKLGLVVDRVGGEDRFQVAENISSRLGNKGYAFVANGLNFPDALAIAPYAASHGYPILLTRDNSVPQYTKDAISGHNNVYVVGGTGSVSDSVYSQIGGDKRIGGADRYEVAANIIRTFDMNPDHAFIATGLTFADALTGSVLAAKENVPLVLTRPDRIPDYTQKITSDEGIGVFTILGGTGSVSTAVANALPSLIKVKSGTSYSVKSQSGQLALYKGSQLVQAFDGSFTMNPSVYSGSTTISIGAHKYIGKMEFTEEGSYVRPINKDIPFEDYLKGVVPHEMPASWNLEALKAQTVAARTYSYDNIGDVVKDDQSYQVYGGYDWYSSSNQAVDGTKGQVLEYNGNLISAVFSSSNGGYTESNSNEWGSSPLPYLPAKADSYDPVNPWSVSINKTQISLAGLDLKNPGHWWDSVNEPDAGVANDLKDWLYANGFNNRRIKITSIDGLSNLQKYSTGVRSKTVDFNIKFILYPLNPDDATAYDSNNNIYEHSVAATINIKNLRYDIGTLKFKSTYITSIDNSQSDKIIINGNGFGHGVGMSQYGAQERAKAGIAYKDILSFYYPGTTLVDKY